MTDGKIPGVFEDVAKISVQDDDMITNGGKKRPQVGLYLDELGFYQIMNHVSSLL